MTARQRLNARYDRYRANRKALRVWYEQGLHQIYQQFKND